MPPVVSLKAPGAQLVQTLAPEPEYLPLAQKSHAPVDTFAKVPGAHFVQLLDALRAYVPAGQSVHEVDPVPDA